MADGTNITPFPRRLRAVESHPQANAYGFAPVAPVIDQDGNRVLIGGRLYRTLMSASNAARVAAALNVLAELGCELPEPPTPPQAA